MSHPSKVCANQFCTCFRFEKSMPQSLLQDSSVLQRGMANLHLPGISKAGNVSDTVLLYGNLWTTSSKYERCYDRQIPAAEGVDLSL